MGKESGYISVKDLAVLAVIAVLWIFSPSVRAEENPGSANMPLFLTGQSPAISVIPHVRLFQDPKRDLSFPQILAQYKSGGGGAPKNKNLLTAAPSSATWFVFTVVNRNPARSVWVLDLGCLTEGTTGIADRVAFFSDANPGQAMIIDGRAVRNKLQMPGQEKNAIPLMLDTMHPRTFALYIETTAGMSLAFNPRIEDQAGYKSLRGKRAFVDDALLAAALLLAGITLLFLQHYRNIVPGLLILYAAAEFLIYQTTDEILPQGNNTVAVHMDVLHALAAVAALLLTQKILFPGSEEQGRLRRLIPLANASILTAIAAGSWMEPSAQMNSVLFLRFLPVALPAFISVLGILTVLKRDDVPQALSCTLAWLALLSGALLSEAGFSGITPLSPGGIAFYWLCFIPHIALLAWSSLRSVAANEAMRLRRRMEMAQKHEEETEFRKTREMTEQAHLLSVLQREKEMMAALRSREAERIQALHHAKEIADEASKAKSDFLAVISHEIRTPMTGIMGMIRLMLDTQLDEKQKECAKTIQYAGDALLALLNDILDFSKVEKGRMEIESVNFDLNRLVESVILLMSGRADENKLALRAEIAPGTPALLKGDPTRLRQILLNLVGNAVKFTEKGSVTLLVREHGRKDGNPHIFFAVRDTGIGISPEAQKNLFSPYTQAHSSISRRFGGTGLGLSICKRLVNAMGGDIQVESRMGAGTTFSFVLPFEGGTAETENAPDAPRSIKPLSVLVVDDNLINQRVIAGLLEKDGHTIVTTGSAENAMDALKERSFDAILMDMEMPNIDGPSATRMIRALKDREKAAIPVIAMTANVMKEDIERCFEAGMNDYCSKPIDSENLRAMLLRVANKEGSFRADPASGPEKIQPRIPSPPPSPPQDGILFTSENLDGLKSSLGAAQMNELMKDLYEKTESIIAAAEQAFRDNDTKTLSGLGHDLYGMTANFGLAGLGVLATKMNRQAKDDSLAGSLGETVGKLRPAYEETRKVVDAWIKE
ncbi:MAG: ATP-binding protein [Pseudomonadota bacterium]